MSEISRFTRFLFRVLPPCERITEMSSLHRDGALGLKGYVQLRLHFLICEWCRRFHVQIGTLGEVAGDELEAPLSDEQVRRIMSRLPEVRNSGDAAGG